MQWNWRALEVARIGGLAAGLLLPLSATAEICPLSLQPPQVTLTVNPGKVVYSRETTRRELNDLRRKYGKVSALDTGVVGLTLTDLSRAMQVEVETRPVGQGRSCAYLRKVDASVGYDQIRVFIARDYRPGSCPDGAILAHENRHVAVFQGTLGRYGPNLRQTLEGAARQQGPLVVGPAADATATFQDRLHRAFDALFKQMNREMDRANAVIDSPASYASDQSRCSDW